jgi:hypothetical protein
MVSKRFQNAVCKSRERLAAMGAAGVLAHLRETFAEERKRGRPVVAMRIPEGCTGFSDGMDRIAKMDAGGVLEMMGSGTPLADAIILQVGFALTVLSRSVAFTEAYVAGVLTHLGLNEGGVDEPTVEAKYIVDIVLEVFRFRAANSR